MLKINIQISIITLTKDDNLKFLKTLKSINSQKVSFNLEWIIIDGSNKQNQVKNKNNIKKRLSEDKQILIKHIDANRVNIFGIYPCMNYGKKISKGNFIIFLNSGDTFFNKNSLKILFEKTLTTDIHSSLIFGQANIIANKKISWNFPGKKLKNINTWLKFFEPNHQSMLVSRTLANKIEFPVKYNLIGDGYWKRNIIKNANYIVYINKPVIKFFLDGVSSTKPSKKVFLDLIYNKEISRIRKFIFAVKFFFPKKIFYFYFLMQKLKSNLFDLII
ncbi:hypothetical protein [Prochlorococcus marinus]|uniref:hypothetical protein n=1 Tax=Prochlorococcus marinus TaxID=1219 RepID=UPI001AD9B38F|nr:hypothetical protein [Prochlorococcus marinus]MBO8221393.1 hypothetical protein [Prochlorococcus marinus CUG1417]MBW3074203.1 hypothetical protein [Prochlorococcus marinus str. MU1417]